MSEPHSWIAATEAERPYKASFSVMRPSQHGEEERVFAEGFATESEARAWIDINPETWPYLPYVEEQS